jgi:hypothetical protein
MHIPATQAFTREGFAFGGVLGGQPCISPECEPHNSAGLVPLPRPAGFSTQRDHNSHTKPCRSNAVVSAASSLW